MVTLLGATMRTMSAANLQEIAEQMRRDSLKPVQDAEPDFAQKLKAVTQRRLFGCRASAANVSANEGDSFGEKVRQAAQRHPNSQASHRRRVEKERSRYRKQQQRKPTKSD